MPMEMLKMIKRTFKEALGKHSCIQTTHFIYLTSFKQACTSFIAISTMPIQK